MITSKWFAEKEFQTCLVPCSLQDMKQEAMDKFDAAREIAGIPFVINTAYRSVEYDKSKGRSGNSAHCSGYAMDISCTTMRNRWLILDALIKVGFNRIGLASSFIHADCSPTLDPKVVWFY